MNHFWLSLSKSKAFQADMVLRSVLCGGAGVTPGCVPTEPCFCLSLVKGWKGHELGPAHPSASSKASPVFINRLCCVSDLCFLCQPWFLIFKMIFFWQTKCVLVCPETCSCCSLLNNFLPSRRDYLGLEICMMPSCSDNVELCCNERKRNFYFGT